MTASGSTFRVQSWCRNRKSLYTACHAWMKISVFAAVLSLETPTAVCGMTRASTGPYGPSPSVNSPSATTANSSQLKMPSRFFSCALMSPGSYPAVWKTEKQKSEGEPKKRGVQGRGQVVFTSSCSLACTSSRREVFLRPWYHSGCRSMPSFKVQRMWSWHLSPGSAVWQLQGLGQLLFEVSCRWAWKASKSESLSRFVYHVGFSSMPLVMAHCTAL
mmetsp:Transcript_49943/g.142905  ORF Transcript_49943/g.142905 Transcript_49943/m.142905 type:complete len:217 (-) Transcript_49943:481-1131(-)